MNEILKIVAHEGATGTYTNYWWETEEAYIVEELFYLGEFSFNDYLGFSTLTEYNHANFFPNDSSNQGFVFNTIGFWSRNEFPAESNTASVIAAECIWNLQSSAIEINLGSINNDGTRKVGNHNIETSLVNGFPNPSNSDLNAGYEWFFGEIGWSESILSGDFYKVIMPSLNWQTGLSYDASLEGVDALNYPAQIGRCKGTDSFQYMPAIVNFFVAGNENGLIPNNEVVNSVANYEKISFSGNWLSFMSYESYNGYNGMTTNSTITDWFLENVNLGELRASYPVPASSSSTKAWNYKNNDYLSWWMGLSVSPVNSPNQLNLFPAQILDYINYAEEFFYPADYYSPLGNENLTHPIDLSSTYSYYYTQSSLPDFVYNGVFGKSQNKFYAPTVLQLHNVFTAESEGSDLQFSATIAFPRPNINNSASVYNGFQANNDTQVLAGGYTGGTTDTTEPFNGEFGVTAEIDQGQYAFGLFSIPQVLQGDGIWRRQYDYNIPSSSEFETTSLTIHNNNLRIRKFGDTNGRPKISTSVKLFCSTSYRLYIRVSYATLFDNVLYRNHSFKVRIWNGVDSSNQSYLVAEGSCKLPQINPSALNDISADFEQDHNFSIDFDTSEDVRIPVNDYMQGGVPTAQKGIYKVELFADNPENDFVGFDLKIDHIRFASNISGVTMQTQDYLESLVIPPPAFSNKIKKPYWRDQGVSSINARGLKWSFDTSLPKSEVIDNSSLYTSTVEQESGTSYLTLSGGAFQTITLQQNELDVMYTSTTMNGFNTTFGAQMFSNPNDPFPTSNVTADANSIWSHSLGGFDLSAGVTFLAFNIQYKFTLKFPDVNGAANKLRGRTIFVCLRKQNGDILRSYWGAYIANYYTIPGSSTAAAGSQVGSQFDVDVVLSNYIVNPSSIWDGPQYIDTGSDNNAYDQGTVNQVFLSISSEESSLSSYQGWSYNNTDNLVGQVIEMHPYSSPNAGDAGEMLPMLESTEGDIGLQPLVGVPVNLEETVTPTYDGFVWLPMQEGYLSGISTVFQNYQGGASVDEEFNLINHQTRRTQDIRNQVPRGKFSFDILEHIPKDAQGFYTDNHFTIEGQLNIVSENFSMFVDTYDFSLGEDVEDNSARGWTNCNAKIRNLTFGTNENAFISRTNKLSNGQDVLNLDPIRMYWNPTENNITSQPFIRVHIPSLLQNAGGEQPELIGTTPIIQISILDYVAAGSSSIDNLIIQSGSYHKVISSGTVGTVTIDDLIIDSEYLKIKLGTWNYGNSTITDGEHGASVVISTIMYGNTNIVPFIYTEFDSDGQGLNIKTNEPTKVPIGTLTYRYYLIANQDNAWGFPIQSSDPFTEYESQFVTSSGITDMSSFTTSTAYNFGFENWQSISAWQTANTVVAWAGFTTNPLINDALGLILYLPSRDELRDAKLELDDSGELFENYNDYPDSTTYHWTSSKGTSDNTKMFAVDLSSSAATTYEKSLDELHRVRMAARIETSEEYDVGHVFMGEMNGINGAFTIWKKEQINSPTQKIKVITDVDIMNDVTNLELLESSPGSTTSFWAEFNPQIADPEVASTFNYLSAATSYYDGKLNTDSIETAVGNFLTLSAPMTKILDYTGGGYTDWYLPSVGELQKANQNVGLAGDGSDEANFADSALSQGENNFYTSTLSIDVFSPNVAVLRYQGFDAETNDLKGNFGVFGSQFQTTDNKRLRAVREFDYAGNVSLGDTLQGGVVFSITPSVDGALPPVIERFFSTQDLLSAIPTTNDWGDLNEVQVAINIESLNAGNYIVFEHNFTQPSEEPIYTSTNSEIPLLPISAELPNPGNVTSTYYQDLGVTNTSIQSGNYVGFRITSYNTNSSNELDIKITSVTVKVVHNLQNSEVIHDWRQETVLELYKEPDFSTTYSCRDFKSISQGASNYSKTLKIPATDANRSAFANLANIKGGNDSNVASGIPISVYKGGASLFQGLGFLQKTIYNDNEKESSLEVVLRGGNASWFSLLKDLKLKDVAGLKALSKFNLITAFGSVNPTIEEVESGVIYPLIDGGKLDLDDQFSRPAVKIKNITPGFRLHSVLSAIFKHIKYDVVSDFLDLNSEFDDFEFDDSWSNTFRSFIGVCPYPSICDESIQDSKIMVGFSGKVESRRYYQTAGGTQFVGNYNHPDSAIASRLIGSPVAFSLGGDNYGTGAKLNVYDYTPLNLNQIVHVGDSSSSVLISQNVTTNFQGAINPPAIGFAQNGMFGSAFEVPYAPESGNFRQTTLSWSGDVSATAITVSRTGFYSVNTQSVVNFIRDSYLTDGNEDVANGIPQDGAYVAGIHEISKFTIILVPNPTDMPNNNTGYEHNVIAGNYNWIPSGQPGRTGRAHSYFFENGSEKYKSINNLRTYQNESVNCHQTQYLMQGVRYYPVAIMSDRVSPYKYYQAYTSLMANTDLDIESSLISGGNVDYHSRHYFELTQCNLTIALTENPCPDEYYDVYYNPFKVSPRISLSDILPDITALDFVSEVSKIFNLVWTTNETIRSITVEPFNDFYMLTPSYEKDFVSTSIDWTDKAYIREQQINSILPKKISYKFKDDSSDATLSYNSSGAKDSVSWGDLEIYTNPSSEKEDEVELRIFSAMKMAWAEELFIDADSLTSEDSNVVGEFEGSISVYLPRVYSEHDLIAYNTNNLKPDFARNFNIKLGVTKGRVSINDYSETEAVNSNNSSVDLFYATNVFDGDSGVTVQAQFANSFQTAYSYSDIDLQIPTCTFSNKAASFDSETFDNVDFNGGLYYQYHKTEIETLKFSDRLIIAEIMLTPADINNLEFRKVIKIKNDYFLLNRIIDFDPKSEAPTKVELVLIHKRGTKEQL